MVDVSTLRSFNRSFTQRIGVLEDSFLGSGRPLGQARLLFDVGVHGASVADLRRRLGLDAGYLSRQLAALEADGLVALRVEPDDRRRRRVALTAKGKRAWKQLDDRSDRLAASLMEPLADRERERLVRALDEAGRILRAATISFEIVDPRGDDARRCRDAYFGELDRLFPSGFDVTGLPASDADAFRAPRGLMICLRSDGEALGCGALSTIDVGVGEIKRMWIHDEMRGLGLGRRLLDHLEQRARSEGHDRVRLDTNEVLGNAVALYEAAGYRQIPRYNDNPYAHHWFEKGLAG